MYDEELPWSDQFPVASGGFPVSSIDFSDEKIIETTEDRETPSQAD